MIERESILIVDDERALAAALAEYFETRGYAPYIAHTGVEARSVMARTALSLVLVDLRLPDVDGDMLVREARGLDSAPEVIIVTGYATVKSAIDAMEAGVVGYVEKPLDLGQLGAVVDRALERRRLLRDNAQLLAQLAERQRQSETLHAISSTVVSTLDLKEALRRICRELARLMGADTASAYLHDTSTDVLLPVAAYHVPKEYLPTLGTVGIPLQEQGFHLALWRDRQPVHSDDVGRDPRFSHELFRRFPHQSGLLIPLALDAGVAGAFYLAWWSERRVFTPDDLSLVEQIAGQVGLFLRNTRLYEQTDRDRGRLAALQEVSRRLGEVHSTDQILTLIVNESTRLLNADAAGLRLVEGDEIVLKAWTESADRVMVRPRLKLGESLSGIVVSTGEPLVVEDLAADARLDPAHRRGAVERGFHGFLAVPLRARGQVVGSLNLFTSRRRRFLPDEVALLSAFADQASLALEKGGLLEDAERGRQLLERLYGVAISMQRSWDRDDRLRAFIRGAHEVVGFDRVNVFLLTQGAAELELITTEGLEGTVPALRLPLSPAAGPFFDAVETRRPVAVLRDEDLERLRPLDPAYRHHPYLRTRRFVVVPLVIGERVIGVASADNRTTRRPIDPRHIEPLSLLCQQLATALEEARLYTETRAREQEATLLYQVAKEITSTLDADRVLDVITATTLEALHGDGCGIFLWDELRGGLAYLRGRQLHPRQGDALVLRAGEGVAGRAFEERRPVWTRDRLADAALTYERETLAFLDVPDAPRAILAAPMISRGQVYGVLVVHSVAPHDFTSDEIRILSTLADHAAIAMENAQLFADAETQRSRLESIFDSTSDGMILVDPNGQIVSANRRAGELLAFDPTTVAGLELTDVLAGHFSSGVDFSRTMHPLQALLEAPDPGGEGDLELSAEGRIVHWVGRPARGAAGRVGLTLTFQDVTREREVSRMKSDFVSFVTHQLRTPLSGIKWLLELSAQSPGMAEEAAEYIQDARQAAERLVGLVNDLLDVSQLESGKLAVNLREVDVGELTRSVLGDVQTLVREKGHRISMPDPEGMIVSADPQLLRQVILNLVSNAIKYTLPGGEIDIGIECLDGALRWQVRDSGIGIPRESQRRLFEKFYRADNVHVVETEGTGLGLYLLKLIVERLGGHVGCESEEGKGSTFYFTLPR